MAKAPETRYGRDMGLPTILFRCDASPEIGGGHVVRCMALAAEFRRVGADVRFAVSNATPNTVGELSSAFPDMICGMTGAPADLDMLRTAFPGGVDALVVDHYGIGAEFEAAASGWARRILAVDDFPNRPHRASYLVDTTLGRTAAEYAAVMPEGAVVLCGSAYAMLREPFRRLRPSRPGMPAAGARPKVLVTLGMTDAPNVTGTALSALAPLGGRIALTVVLGANAPHLADVRDLAARADASWRIVAGAGAEEMADLTAACDFVIGAPGSASYERCCLGKPALLIQFADNQAGNAAALAEAGAAELIGRHPDVSANEIEAAVLGLIADPGRLRAMSRAARAVTDGDGVERIVAAVLG